MHFELSDLEYIEELASQSYTAKAIALVLDVEPTLFATLCSDETHQVGKAYLTGKLEIEKTKNEVLISKVDDESFTAFQVHDKKMKEQRFLDVKDDIYS